MKCLRRPQILHVDVLPFSLAEARVASLDARRIRGGFPRSFLADDDEGSWQWRLHLDQLTVVVPGDADYPLADGIRVCGLNAAVGDRGSRAGS